MPESTIGEDPARDAVLVYRIGVAMAAAGERLLPEGEGLTTTGQRTCYRKRLNGFRP